MLIQSTVVFFEGYTQRNKIGAVMEYDGTTIYVRNENGGMPVLTFSPSDITSYDDRRRPQLGFVLHGKSYTANFAGLARQTFAQSLGLLGLLFIRSAEKKIASTGYDQWVHLFEQTGRPRKINPATKRVLLIAFTALFVILLGLFILSAVENKNKSSDPTDTTTTYTIPRLTIDTLPPVSLNTLPVETTP